MIYLILCGSVAQDFALAFLYHIMLRIPVFQTFRVYSVVLCYIVLPALLSKNYRIMSYR